MKIAVRRLIREEKGQALVLALILLLVGGLVIAPLLDLMGTGLKVGKEVYENKMYEIYAADAGVEDGLWQIKHDRLVDFAGYNEYDYSGQWQYSLNESVHGVTETVNGYDVNVTIKNIWMPKDIPAPDTVPDAVTARQIIELGKLIITGSPSAAESTYKIEISYQRECGNLLVKTIGIWLPPGFEYNGNCSLEGEDYYPEPQIDAYKGGYAVVWNFAPFVLFEDFPGGIITESMLIKSFTFEYTGPEGQSPDNAVSWIDTSGADIGAATYTWDADVKIYQIVSVAGDCEVEAYAAEIEMRKLGAAISGDYHAIGNTLMTCTSGFCPSYRNRLYKESSATVAAGDIPSNALIKAAYLYWSGWIEGDEQGVWPPESCDDMNDWIPGSHWSIWSWLGDKEFLGQGGGSAADRTLTMHISADPNHCLDLSPYSGQEVTVSWSQREWESWGYPPPQLESYDCLKYAFSGDGGEHWSEYFPAFCDDNPSSSFSDTIPDGYLTDSFKMRFFLDFDETNEYVYIDDITISVSSEGPSVEDAKVNRVMFNGNQITADEWQVAGTSDAGTQPGSTGGENSWCYSCFCDVTASVNAALDPDTKSGTFTLGHALLGGTGTQLYNYPSGTTDGKTDYPLATPALSTATQYMWTYAGWSLIIIYSSPETEGHQLYLFGDLYYVAVHTTLDFPLSGFLVPDPVAGEQNAAHITCFVGDGDEHFPGDYIALKDQEGDEHKLSDGIVVGSTRAPWPLNPPYEYYANPYDNVWNSKFLGPDGNVVEGIDIDTFSVRWDDDVLQPGDTAAEVSLGNASSYEDNAELIMVVYIIISFRSATTSGGSISYLIRG